MIDETYDDFNTAEQELIAMADADLAAHGVEIPEEEPVEERVRPAEIRSERPTPNLADHRLPKKFKLTKKAEAISIYNDIAGKGHGRKMTIQRFIDVLRMNPATASTYYQNIKSGKWS